MVTSGWTRSSIALAAWFVLGHAGVDARLGGGAVTANPSAGEWQLAAGWPRLASGLRLGEASGVGLDSKGHVLVFHRAGRKFDPTATEPISASTVLELDAATGALLNSWGAGMFLVPHSLTVDARDDVWLTDVGRQQVLEFSHDGTLLRTLGERRKPGWDATHFNQPTDVFVSADGSFYVSDGYQNARVARFDSSGKLVREWGSPGTGRGQFNVPHGVALGTPNRVYVADRENERLQVFDSAGRWLGQWPTSGGAGRVFDVAVSETGRVYVALKGGPDLVAILDRDLHLVERIPATAARVTTAHALAVQGDSAIYLADTGGQQLLKFVRR